MNQIEEEGEEAMSVSNIFTYETLVHAIAGATGSVIGVSTFYPLEIVKLRQIINKPHASTSGGVARDSNGKMVCGKDEHENDSILKQLETIVRDEGVLALYQALEPMVKSLYASNFVYFYSFHALKNVYSSEQQSVMRDLLLSSIAGIINVLTTTPLWVVNTRLKVTSNQYDGLGHGLKKIYKEEGLSALWKGTIASLVLVTNPAIQMTVYELLKRYAHNVGGESSLKFFMLASISKIVSTLVTYPVQIAQNVQRISQNPSSSSKQKANSMVDILLYIFKYEGVRGLYRGVEAKIWQTVLTAALMFVAYEKIVSFIFKTFSIQKNLKS